MRKGGEMLKLAFDIGGILSKYPNEFKQLVRCIQMGNLENLRFSKDELVQIHIISDIKPHSKAVKIVHDNGFNIPYSRIHVADYEKYGENCKAVLCKELDIDILIDDHIGYLSEPNCPPIRLLMMPDQYKPYYNDGWKTDGSEGNFGRHKCSEDI